MGLKLETCMGHIRDKYGLNKPELQLSSCGIDMGSEIWILTTVYENIIDFFFLLWVKRDLAKWSFEMSQLSVDLLEKYD